MTLTPSADVRFAIGDLFAKYAWSLDTGDTDALLSCFTEDASFGDGSVTVTGHERIRKMMLQRYHANPIFPGRQHWVGQSVYESAGTEAEPAWHVRSFAQVVLLRDIGAKLWWVGHYDDLLVPGGDGWLFKRRLADRWQGAVLSGFPKDSIAPLIMERPANYFDPL